jgi:hypothetical protein
MKTKPRSKEANAPPDPFQAHRAAWRRLSAELANYREKLVPELKTILSAKTLTQAQAEETTDLEKLDALCIRLRSLEIREKVASQKADASEKWLQATLAVHIERDERLGAYWEKLLLAEALTDLQRHFPATTPELAATLEGLAVQTSRYLEGKVKQRIGHGVASVPRFFDLFQFGKN